MKQHAFGNGGGKMHKRKLAQFGDANKASVTIKNHTAAAGASRHRLAVPDKEPDKEPNKEEESEEESRPQRGGTEMHRFARPQLGHTESPAAVGQHWAPQRSNTKTLRRAAAGRN